jgi:hypothetical protein
MSLQHLETSNIGHMYKNITFLSPGLYCRPGSVHYDPYSMLLPVGVVATDVEEM